MCRKTEGEEGKRMMRPSLLLAPIISAAVFGCSPNPSAMAPGSTANARPPARPAASTRPANTADPATLLDELASEPSLRLTADRDSASSHFHFLSSVMTVTGGNERGTNVTVVREDARVAMLCTSAGGLPYCYATRGFVVSLDPARAGGLIVFHGGAPEFTLSVAPETGRLVYQFSYVVRQADPSIDLDLAALVRGVREKLRSAKFDRERQTIEARTENAMVLVSLGRSPSHPFPVTDFLMENLRTGNKVMVAGIATGSPPPFDTSAVTEASVRGLGLPVRNLTADDVRTIDLMVPLDFGKNLAERRAAKRLRELIGPPVPATDHTTRAEAMGTASPTRFVRSR